MTSLVFDVHGNRISVRASPMQTLGAVAEHVLRQAGLTDSVDVSDVRLIHNKRELELNTPFRFLNVPAAARIELITGAEPRLGLQRSGGPQARPAQTPVSSAAPASASAQQAAHPTQHGDLPAASARAPDDAVHAAAPAPGRLPPPPPTASAAGQQAGSGTLGVVLPDPLGLGRPVLVYSRWALEAAEGGAGPGAAEPSDDFFEFTAEDFHRVTAAAGRAAQKREAGLRTAKLRADELRARAARFGPVPVRVHLPDGMVLQASFQPLEPLQKLKDLVTACVQPAYHSAALYTAPPKQVIRDLSVSFYEAGLVPAAHVHLAQPQQPQPPEAAVLRSEVAALQGEPPQRGTTEASANGSKCESESLQQRAAAGAESGAPAASKSTAAGSKVPKWLKVGK